MAATTSRRRSVQWVVIVALAIGMLVVATVDRDDGPQNNTERAYALAGQFACPFCDGQTVAESDIPIARAIRAEIFERLDQGQTEAQIRQYLVAQYGEDIDYTPRATGVTGLVWILPVVVVVLAFAGLVAVFLKWRREEQSVATDEDRALVARVRGGDT
jgi:cytochrome c-type biogenesis protein CcmH